MKNYIITEQQKSNLLNLLMSATHTTVPWSKVNAILMELQESPEHTEKKTK